MEQQTLVAAVAVLTKQGHQVLAVQALSSSLTQVQPNKWLVVL